jgi:hypothetical protein
VAVALPHRRHSFYRFWIYRLSTTPPVPERLTWGWNARQKEIAVRRSREAFNVEGAKINVRQLLELVRDAKAWFYSKSFPVILQRGFGFLDGFIPSSPLSLSFLFPSLPVTGHRYLQLTDVA